MHLTKYDLVYNLFFLPLIEQAVYVLTFVGLISLVVKGLIFSSPHLARILILITDQGSQWHTGDCVCMCKRGEYPVAAGAAPAANEARGCICAG
jgi:hypothetical protein